MTKTGAQRISYLLGETQFFAYRQPTESRITAVARSVAKRTANNVQLWFAEKRDDGEAHTAKWYDAETETFHEAEVVF